MKAVCPLRRGSSDAYTEAVATLDADVLIAVPQPDRRDVLGPIWLDPVPLEVSR